MNRHTPGPWTIRPNLEGHVFAGDQLIAGCMGHSRNFNDANLRDEQLANAQLIAAAPEMRDALEFIAFCLSERVDHTIAPSFITLATLVDKARAAIAKAEGR